MAKEIIEKRFVIKSADIPHKKVYYDIDVDVLLEDKLLKVYVQLERSSTLFYKGADIFYKGRTLVCDFKFIGSEYSIKRSVYPTLDNNGSFYFFVDREILGSRIELHIKEFNHTITFNLRMERHIAKPTAVCWCNTESLKGDDSGKLEKDKRISQIYPNEDGFLHIATQGIFYRKLLVDLIDSKGLKLSSTTILVRKNAGVAVFSMEELKAQFKTKYSKELPANAKFFARVNSTENYDSNSMTLVLDGKVASTPAKASPVMGTAKAQTGNSDSKEVEDKKKTNFKMAIFFDGTCNNKDNVKARETYEELTKKKDGKLDSVKFDELYKQTPEREKRAPLQAYQDYGDDDSYQNDKSNVTKLWDVYSEVPQKVYVEGIATTRYNAEKMEYGGDSTYTSATGKGGTGIVAKVENGITDIIQKTNESGNKNFESITIDVYGFSRGAAAARHFIAEISQNGVLGRTPPYGKLGVQFQQNSITTKRLIIRFTGLFDTVSSHGVDFSDDVEALQLHKVAKSRRTVQLAAADEYRKNFALTRIGSCGNRGLELFLPGSHADIGGGYRDKDKEEIKKIIYESSDKGYIEELRNKLINEGWYQDDQIKIEEHIKYINGSMYAPPSYYHLYTLIGNRDNVSNKYANIPLRIMKDLTDEYTKDQGFNSDFNDTYAIDNSLSTIENALKAYVGDEKRKSGINAYETYCDSLDLKKLRNEHLHWSATIKKTNVFFMPHKPNLEEQRLKRIRYEDN